MKVNQLVLNMNYAEICKKEMVLKFMLYNKYDWLEDDVCGDHFLRDSRDQQVLEGINEFNRKLYFSILKEVERWTKEISNSRELAISLVEQAFPGVDFKISKIKDGFMGIEFSEGVDLKDNKLFNATPEKAETFRDILEEIEKWEKEFEFESYTFNLSSNWILKDEFIFHFSSKLGYSVEDAM